MRVKYSKLLQYRNVWLGLAMLWIVWYHLDVPSVVAVLSYPRAIGYGGVDICLFASGIGCYYSLTKNSDPIAFIKRRFWRIAPTYLAVMAVWLVFKLAVGQMNLLAALGNLLGVQYLTGLGSEFNWYITALVILYLLAPYFKSAVDSQKSMLKQLLGAAALFVVTLPFVGSELLMLVSRMPLFYIGMIFAKYCVSENSVCKRDLVLMGASTIIGVAVLLFAFVRMQSTLSAYGLYWYPFILITPGLCVAISLVFYTLRKNKLVQLVRIALEVIGRHSFEIYLVHMSVFSVVKYFVKQKAIWPDNMLVHGLSLICVAVLSVALKLLINKAVALMKK